MHLPALPFLLVTFRLLLPSLVTALDSENLQHGDRIPGANPDDPEELVIDVSKMGGGFPGFEILEEPVDGEGAGTVKGQKMQVKQGGGKGGKEKGKVKKKDGQGVGKEKDWRNDL